MSKRLVLTTLLMLSIGEIFTPKIFASSIRVNPKQLISPISGKAINKLPNSPTVVLPSMNTSRLKIMAKAMKDEEDAKQALLIQITELTKQLEELRQKYNVSEASKKTLTASIADKERSIESITEEKEKVAKELEKKCSELKTTGEQSETFKKSIEESKKRMEELNSALEKANQEKVQLTETMKKAEAESKKLQTSLDQKTKELEELQGKNKQLQGGIIYAKIKQSLRETLVASLDLYEQKEKLILTALQRLIQDDFAKIDEEHAVQLSRLLPTVVTQVEASFSIFFKDRQKSIESKIENRRSMILDNQGKGMAEDSILETVTEDAKNSLIKDCSTFEPEKALWECLSESFSVFGITLKRVEEVSFSELIPNYEELIKHRPIVTSIGSSPLSTVNSDASDEEEDLGNTLMQGLKSRHKKLDDK